MPNIATVCVLRPPVPCPFEAMPGFFLTRKTPDPRPQTQTRGEVVGGWVRSPGCGFRRSAGKCLGNALSGPIFGVLGGGGRSCAGLAGWVGGSSLPGSHKKSPADAEPQLPSPVHMGEPPPKPRRLDIQLSLCIAILPGLPFMPSEAKMGTTQPAKGMLVQPL